MYRAAAIAAAFLLFLLVGPWVLLLAVAALFVPRVRRWLRPGAPVAGRRHHGGCARPARRPGRGDPRRLAADPARARAARDTRLRRPGGADPAGDRGRGAAAPTSGAQRHELDAQRRLGHRLLRRCRPDRRPARRRLGMVRGRGVRHPRVRLPRPDRRALRRPRGSDAADPRRRDRCGRSRPRTCPTAPTSRASGRGRTSAVARTSTSTSTTAPSSPPPTAGSWRSPRPTPTASPTSPWTRRTTSATWCPRTTA